MGEAALRSHMSGVKHKRSISTRTTQLYQTASSSVVTAPPPPKKNTLTTFSENTAVLKAEIMWCLKAVNSHFSFRSSSDISETFKVMFPDSSLAQKFACGVDKTSYLSTYGLGPYFLSLLKDSARNSSQYTLLFDESLNRKLQSKQMDVHIRFWDGNQVKTRYAHSDFLGHATASIIHDKLWEIVDDFGINKMIQISMDGPNVNWKVFDTLCTEVDNQSNKKLLNVGSCGLHIIHNGFRGGCEASGWNLEEILFCMHQLFKDSPARREDYIKITDSHEFPARFCKHRWLKNISVMERAINILPHLQSYISSVKSGKVTNPKNKSFAIMMEAVQDPLFPVKGHIFISIASEIEPFLKSFQTDAPKLPFVSSELYNMMYNLLDRFVKPSVMSTITNERHLYRLDINDKEQYKETAKVTVGFVAKKLLSELKFQKKVSDKDIFGLKVDTRNFIIKILKKLLEKSLIKYQLVRSLSWLEPAKLLKKPDICKTSLETCLKILSKAGHVQEQKFDLVIKQYQKLLDGVKFSPEDSDFDKLANFDVERDRLDIVYYDCIKDKPAFNQLWPVIELVLCLSHGQATVEHGFSTNKELVVENQKAESLTARRLIVDHIRVVGGICNVDISRKMFSYASGARTKYRNYLQEQSTENKSQEKRKANEVEAETQRIKKRRLEKDIEVLLKNANELSEKAEKNGDLSILAQSNAMRQGAKDKQSELSCMISI